MPTRRTVLGASLGALLVAGQAVDAAALAAYQGRKRPLVIFAPAADHPLLQRQRNDINGNRLALSDRDIVVVYVVAAAVNTEFGSGPGMSGAALRTRFRVGEGAFRVLLIGKDGGVKLESAAPILHGDILSEIDRLPMRREEIRRRGR